MLSINFKKLIASFSCAFSGIRWIFATQQTFRIQIIIGFLVLSLALIIGVSRTEFLILLLTAALVLILEIINSFLEKLLDILRTELDGKIRVFKDAIAGIVLISVIFSIIIGVIIFLPRIVETLTRFLAGDK